MTDVFSIAQGNGFYNPPFAFDVALPCLLAEVKSPKSVASPTVAKFTYSIMFVAGSPPANIARVGADVP